MLDTKKTKLGDLLSAGIAISHDNIDKSKVGEKDVKSMSTHNFALENQVKYYKGAQDALRKFIKEVYEDN
jgi:hypothetical protein